MTYLEWFEAHGTKHAKIMAKLTHLNDDEVIEYFRFENMVKNEHDFCLLYAENTKCHDMKNLNCYLCACPYFRFDDMGLQREGEKTLFSLCSIDSPEGDRFITGTAIHQNCTGCLIPHQESTIKKVFHRNWFAIMKKAPPKNVCSSDDYPE